MKGKGINTGVRRVKDKPAMRTGVEAAAAVVAAGGRVPKKFLKEFAKARPASAGPTREAAAAHAKITPARRVAYEVLTAVEAERGHSDDLLRGPGMEGLAEADRNLATALVMGTLRWQIALDAEVRGLLERPGQRLASEVALVLRMGAFQLLHMDRIPAHAALSESVEMCRAAGHPHATGMVNAILRKVATGRPSSQNREAGLPIFETTAKIAERLGHPAWMVERWVANYGWEAALAVCAADQEEPVGGRLFAAEDGLPVIDDGSRLVAELAVAAMPAGGSRVWDCCAAPGGKTLMLAARLPEAEVLATDVSAKRMGLMQGRLRRVPYAGKVTTAVADASAMATVGKTAGEFDLILCDVPCSGTGTLGRNPEIRLRLAAEDLARQAARQREILAAALGRLAPGGRLVYSTCSLEPEECERVVEAAAVGWRRVPASGLLSREFAGMVRDGALRTLPGVDPCDGFYAVVLER